MVKVMHAKANWGWTTRRLAVDGFGITLLNPGAPDGNVWACRWGRGVERTLTWGMDKRDKRFQVLGLTTCRIAGYGGPRAGEARLSGPAPCLFVRGFQEDGPGGDVEITLYAAAGAGVLRLSHAGLEAACLPLGPEGTWIGFKLVSRADGHAGRRGELFIDRGGGLAGGAWESLGRLEAGTDGEGASDSSVYVRLSGCAGMTLRRFSVREILPPGKPDRSDWTADMPGVSAGGPAAASATRDSGVFGW